MWTIKFRNGNMKRFKFPIRTTPEGSIEPYAGKPAINMADLDKPGVFTMTGALKGDRSQLICL
jgi:adenylylsulfate reductase subunit B